MKTFGLRAISGIIYALIMITAILWEQLYFYLAVILFFQFICTQELFNIGKKIFPTQHFNTGHFIMALIMNICLLIFAILNDGIFLIPIVIWFVGMMTHLIFSKKQLYASATTSWMAVIYIGIPLMCLSQLKFIDPIIPLGVLFMVWINDTMAYIIGSLIGKTPLSEISPKKTLEGTLGGIICTMLLAALITWIYDTGLDIWIWVCLGLIVGVFGNIGDLFESFLKRKAQIKDSGKIMPGHGGLLDRLDSLLFVFPIVYVFIICLNLLSVI